MMMGIADMTKEGVLELREAGYTIAQVAKYYRIDYTRCRDRMRELGVSTIPLPKLPKIIREQMQAWIDEGKSIRQIADENHMSWASARALANKFGINVRARVANKSVVAKELKAQGKSQEQIAKLTGMSIGWVSNVCRGFDKAPDKMMIQDKEVSLHLRRHPEAPDLSKYRTHWTAGLANSVIGQALRDLWSGTIMQQESAADFFRSGNYIMWAWLTEYRPDEVYTLAVQISRRERSLPGDAAPKNFGIVLD